MVYVPHMPFAMHTAVMKKPARIYRENADNCAHFKIRPDVPDRSNGFVLLPEASGSLSNSDMSRAAAI